MRCLRLQPMRLVASHRRLYKETLHMASMDYTTRMAVENMAREKVMEASQANSFPINMDAALYRTADNMGLGEIKSDEVRFNVANRIIIAQGFTDGILYVEEGEWGDIKRISWPAKTVSAAGAGTAPTSRESSGSRSA